jgi:acetyltransferase-like isoleucine patch superfamily enzyme
MNSIDLTNIATDTPISREHTPRTIGDLTRNFLRRPLRERMPLLTKLLRGLINARTFDTCSWPLMERGAQIHKHRGRITAGRFVTFCGNSQIAVVGSDNAAAWLDIGEFTSIGPGTVINVAEGLRIGKRCLIAWNCDIMDTDFHTIIFSESEPARPISAPVYIGDDVWIGARCIILKGVNIGENSVIGAGSVVISDIPPHSLAAGNPARVIRTIAGWKR